MIETSYNEAGERIYHTPNGDYISITSLLGRLPKDAIDKWRDRIGHEEADRITQESADRGSFVHACAEAYIKSEPDELKRLLAYAPATKKMLWRKLKKTLDKHLGTVHEVEIALWSDRLHIAGRVDLIAEWDGCLSIIDFKTSRGTKKKEWIENYWLQTCFYSLAYLERTGNNAEKLVIPIINRYGEVEVFVSDRKTYLTKFLTFVRNSDIL